MERAEWIRAIGTTLVAIALQVLPAAGQQESVELQLKLSRGETLRYAVTGTAQKSETLSRRLNYFLIIGWPIDADERYGGTHALRVMDVTPDGSSQVESLLEDYRPEDGRLMWLAPLVVRVQPDGRVVERLLGAETLHVDYLPLALPGRAVRVGESWTQRLRFGLPRFVLQGSGTFTLARLEAAAGGRIAVVRFRIEGVPIGRTPPVLERANGQLSGEAHWSIERGRLVMMSGEFVAEYDGRLRVPNISVGSDGRISSGGSADIAVTQRISGTFRQELTERIPAPPTVGPDLLITPGSAIGAFFLDQSLSDVSVGGMPQQRPPDLGYRARSVEWSIETKVAAFLDAENREKLVGLEIHDARYRTEQGVGVGSSEGMVLLASGLSPIRINMTIPRLGSYRILIYNDRGIAFAITAASIERPARQTAPSGMADWITIFPPGGAGKIFPLP